LPDLIQVNFTFATVDVIPALVQVAPDLTLAAPASGSARVEARMIKDIKGEILRMC